MGEGGLKKISGTINETSRRDEPSTKAYLSLDMDVLRSISRRLSREVGWWVLIKLCE